jgi:hypothetical protein
MGISHNLLAAALGLMPAVAHGALKIRIVVRQVTFRRWRASRRRLKLPALFFYVEDKADKEKTLRSTSA